MLAKALQLSRPHHCEHFEDRGKRYKSRREGNLALGAPLASPWGGQALPSVPAPHPPRILFKTRPNSPQLIINSTITAEDACTYVHVFDIYDLLTTGLGPDVTLCSFAVSRDLYKPIYKMPMLIHATHCIMIHATYVHYA